MGLNAYVTFLLLIHISIVEIQIGGITIWKNGEISKDMKGST